MNQPRKKESGFWGRRVYEVDEWKLGSSRNGQPNWNDGRVEVTFAEDAVLVSSEQLENDGHLPVLDLDIPHHYVPSTTPGHGHLYLDTPLTTFEYGELLEVLQRLRIIEPGFRQGFIERGATFARLPWIFKRPVDPEHNEHDLPQLPF